MKRRGDMDLILENSINHHKIEFNISMKRKNFES
jgi:hypothetical protein